MENFARCLKQKCNTALLVTRPCLRGTRASVGKHELIPARAAQCQTRGDAVARPEVRANPRVKP